MEADTATHVLPATFWEAAKAELRRALHSPYEVPIVVLCNGLLVVIFWFSPWKDEMFKLHGALAFPVLLGSWMYSDVPATNVLGSDRIRARVALGDEQADKVLMRLLAAKMFVLWLLIAPACIITAIIIGIVKGQPLSAFYTVLFVAIVPLGALAVADWMGILWPYHPVQLKLRWQDRKQRRAQIRWMLLVTMPYVVVPFIFVVVSLPAVGWWYYKTDGQVSRLSDSLVGQLTVIAAVTSIAFFFLGRLVSRRLLLSRREQLADYLSEPRSG